MLPFFVNTNNYEYPLSGDVTQDIAPAFFAAMNGTPEVEKEIVTKVASYGDQIGALTDVVLALAKAQGVKGEEVDELHRIASEVQGIKETVKADLRARAEAAMKRLKAADPDEYAKMIAAATD